MVTSFGKGLLLGFSIAAPVGPIGLLCIRRSVAQGRLVGFISGLGAATADVCYGALAALGLTAVTQALVHQQIWLQLGGGIFLVYLGVGSMRSRPPGASTSSNATKTLGGAYGSTLALTLTNPMTILSFVGIFAGLGLGATTGPAYAALTIAGVFFGSAFWWLLLSTTAAWLGGRLQQGGLRVISLLSGAIIIGFGLWQLAATVRSLR